jgi:hypothetical protein
MVKREKRVASSEVSLKRSALSVRVQVQLSSVDAGMRERVAKEEERTKVDFNFCSSYTQEPAGNCWRATRGSHGTSSFLPNPRSG